MLRSIIPTSRNNFRSINVARRSPFSSKPKRSSEEIEEAIKDATEKMKYYQANRPSLQVIRESQKRSKQREREHMTQLMVLSGFLTCFVVTPLLGRKIALDEDFRKRMVPSWYDFSIEKPKSEWTRQEFHERLVKAQMELHEKAKRGDFSPEKLDQMRRHFEGVDPEKDIHGWGKLHPGLDDDESIEDD